MAAESRRLKFTSISAATQHCARLFANLTPPEELVRDIEIQKSRLNIWAGNLGVFASGIASADARLQEDEDIKNVILDILAELAEQLHEPITSCRPDDSSERDTGTATYKDVDSEATSSIIFDSDVSLDDGNPLPSNDQLPTCVRSIRDRITSLYGFTTILRKPNVHLMNERVRRYIEQSQGMFDFSELERYTQIRIELECPRLHDSPELVDRLVGAVLARHQRIMYQQTHHHKLEGGLEDALALTDTESSSLPADVISSKPPSQGLLTRRFASVEKMDFSFPDLQPLGMNEDYQSTYEKYITTSSINPSTARRHGVLDIPPVPRTRAASSGDIQCPYCARSIAHELGNDEATRLNWWRRHVLEDLEPYVCLFKGCPLVSNTFKTTQDWIEHMKCEHTGLYMCHFPHGVPCFFSEPGELEIHLKEIHSNAIPESSFPDLVRLAYSPAPDVFISLAAHWQPTPIANKGRLQLCPLCYYLDPEDDPWDSHCSDDDALRLSGEVYRQVQDHIAFHLEMIALLALPGNARNIDNEYTVSTEPDEYVDNGNMGILTTDKGSEGANPPWSMQSSNDISKGLRASSFTIMNEVSWSVMDWLRRDSMHSPWITLGQRISQNIYPTIQGNRLKIWVHNHETTCRDVLPTNSIGVSLWLETISHLTKKAKVTLAYNLARCLLEYYKPDWMIPSWTDGSMDLFHQTVSKSYRTNPHLYLVFKQQKFRVQHLWERDDIFHRYPSILALGILLLEISVGDSFEPAGENLVWGKELINDYSVWACMIMYQNDVGNIGSVYEETMTSPLDGELFRKVSLTTPRHGDQDTPPQRNLYSRVVLPLEKLHHAYQHGWVISEVSRSITVDNTESSIISSSARQTYVQFQWSDTLIAAKPASRDDFTVAIICSMPLEANPVAALLDALWHETGYGKARGDDNSYRLGRIARHNVVLVHMPGPGQASASQAASSLRSSFVRLRLTLVVGICSGAPYSGNNEIILGDVVMGESNPTAVVPNLVIRRSLTTMMMSHNRLQMEGNICRYLEKLALKDELLKAWYPGVEKDELYQPTYRHKHQNASMCDTCARCNTAADPVCAESRLNSCAVLGCRREMLVPRTRLDRAACQGRPPSPAVHVGRFGAGDTQMKSGQDRDTMAAQNDLIAFEMESAGVWDELPCLIIKGVCDYGDSHKNTAWQSYAAATAAACTRAFLDSWD